MKPVDTEKAAEATRTTIDEVRKKVTGNAHTCGDLDVTLEIQETRTLCDPLETERTAACRRSPTSSTEEGKVAPNAGERARRRSLSEWYGEFINRPFSQYLVECYARNEAELSTHEWMSPIFYFVFLVRAHPDMTPHLNNPLSALAIVEHHIRSWTKSRPRDNVPYYTLGLGPTWGSWFGLQEIDARAEFCDVWGKIRYRPGYDPLAQAIDAAKTNRLGLPAELREKRPLAAPGRGDDRDYQAFISVAGHLQVIVGDKAIRLPCKKLSELMGVSKMTISRYRCWAIEDDFLVLVTPHTFRSKGQSDATEFRFNVSLCDLLRKRSQTGTDCSYRELRIKP